MSNSRFAGAALRTALEKSARRAIAASLSVPAARLAEAAGEGGRIEAAGGALAVVFAGPELFAREFGSLGEPAAPVIAPAVDALNGRRP